ncbi:unnamed protein product [Adineta ricciae]|uniref:Transposase n=1 Tax=Adineta ricciae TaxID=249248 RepID=A0A815SWN9_ADIRI|nr:unnamed protein product [Adineta ricciae]CAF1657135.1 unnamed protein product [Adineta ricciae]
MGRKSINETKRAQAVALFDAGFKISKIADQLNISWTCAKNAVKRYSTYGTYKDRPRTGRPMKITKRGDRYIKRLTKGGDRANSNLITQNLNESLPQRVSARTVQRHLHKLGYKYAAKIKKPFLKKCHKVQRLLWCKKFRSYTVQDWRHVIFSDETTYYVLKRKNKVMVWRTDAEKLNYDCIQQMNTGNGGKVGIWGGICGYGTTTALFYSDNMNSTKYCEVLKNQLIPSMKKLPNRHKFTFQQDLAPWHTSKMVKEQIKKLKIKLLDWAPKSPDLSVIEELWNILDKRLQSKPINNKTELQQCLQTEWEKITADLCRSLIDTIPTRIEKCIKARGGHFI